jgi:hypothetical protein
MERRMAERKEFNRLVEFDMGAASGLSGNKHNVAHARNISAGGVGISTDLSLLKGTVLRLGLPVSGPETILPVFAEVAWAVSGGHGCMAGLRFLK